jgi:hypothetical protein
MKKIVIPLFVISILILAACGPAASTSEAVEPAQASIPTQGVMDEGTAEPNLAPTNTAEPTPLPPTATPQPEPLTVIAQGFGLMEGRSFGYGFIVENPNQEFAFESSEYEITAYDANGASVTVITDRTGSILPGQKLGVAGTDYFNEEVSVAKIEVKFTQGKAYSIQSLPPVTVVPLTADKVTLIPSQSQYETNLVSAVVTNPSDMVISYTQVSFIAYNDAGEIIGGGYDSVGMVPAKSAVGVHTQLIASGEVAKVEMYPAPYSLGEMFHMREMEEGAQAPTLVKQGFGVDEIGNAGYGMLIQNPNSNHLVVQNIQITFYAEDGSVLGASSDQVYLFPNTTTGVAGAFGLIQDKDIARADFQMLPLIYQESGELPVITASNVSTSTGGFFNASGEISNPTAADIERPRVDGIAYNEAGEIIGGGHSYVDILPANGSAAVEMNVSAAGTIAKVEFFIWYRVK